MIKLIGIGLVALGFALRLNPLLVVLLAASATAWAADIGPVELLQLLGQYFIDNRFMTLPVVLLIPVAGVLERYGLQERAATLISRLRNATAGRVMLLYQFLRELASTVGIKIGDHASMIRPLIVPMAEGAATARCGELSGELRTRIRAHAAASENWGNFFADDIIVAIGPVLLMKGVFDAAGVPVSIWALGLWGIPTALAALGLGWWRFHRLDKLIEAQHLAAKPEGKP